MFTIKAFLASRECRSNQKNTGHSLLPIHKRPIHVPQNLGLSDASQSGRAYDSGDRQKCRGFMPSCRSSLHHGERHHRVARHDPRTPCQRRRRTSLSWHVNDLLFGI